MPPELLEMIEAPEQNMPSAEEAAMHYDDEEIGDAYEELKIEEAGL